MNASSLKLMMPDTACVSLADLQLLTIHFNHIEPHKPIEEFHGVIGQDGELIHKDDYNIELISCHYQVRHVQLTEYNNNSFYYTISSVMFLISHF